ncbi:helix-turn-helix domain-containing protein [Mediterraneibacter faecis]|uniref:helix-turn-helix domain-containing protein n=1 Tax=Mediterraneibacter faecis TaxID=592978 RepID=UPI001FABF63F|nr:helix-turn-helix transcriptional regulator [Mediterraneibacter faecis]
MNVTRQAVSNWENNRNLPDIEMLILIAQTFHISLDNLILGGNKEMNEMKNAMEQNLMVRKLVKDGSET